MERQPRVGADTNSSEADKPSEPRRCGLICRIRERIDGDQTKSKFERDYQYYKRGADWEADEPNSSDPNSSSTQDQPKPGEGKGVWHIVKKGETLFRIGKAYQVDVDLLIRANRLEHPSNLKEGLKLWVPGVKKAIKEPITREYLETHESTQPNQTTNASSPHHPDSKANSKADPKTDSKADPANSAKRGTFLFPVPGGKLSSGFGTRGANMHEGFDLTAAEGTNIIATDDGKVVYADDSIRGYGNMIIIKHAGNLSTVYAHNSNNLVKVGDIVKRGQKIAEVGQTGRATCPHCHFEVRLGEKAVNPAYYLP